MQKLHLFIASHHLGLQPPDRQPICETRHAEPRPRCKLAGLRSSHRLTQHGVAANRLVAKGYGQERPIVPNDSDEQKARNRRVQFIIIEQETGP
jgi:hypothetical protein